ncbi:MAG: methyl-accepting chemotaxis protein [Oscillospiraceae bacterium]|nr:methyl-accepting chemotaxis protein [Oscillospiraceae bacterium]
MKNLKVSAKLITSFLIIAVLTAIVGVVGIYGMVQINNSFDEMYEMQTVPMPDLAKAIEELQRQRANMRELIIGSALDDFEMMDRARANADHSHEEMQKSLDSYYETIKSEEAKRLFYEARELYENEFRVGFMRIYDGAKGDIEPAELYTIMREYTAATDKIIENFDICFDMKIDTAANAAQSASSMADLLLWLIIGVLVVALAAAVFLALYISGLISKPLVILSTFMKKAGTTGDIALSPDDMSNINKFAQGKDEIGQTIAGSAAFLQHVTNIAGKLETIANGDLTIDVQMLSNSDTMGKSLSQMVDNLNNILNGIQTSTSQVSTGAKQVADGAQALAQGSTEQAASVQELSSSIAEIASKTKENAETAGKTSKLSETIKQNALKGSTQMDDMIGAVKEINDASQSISKIIKTIDDIAFQTNILALNAAVEAARAGQHGKGFAVVAEEVRNLASKSAEAARDTGDMIQNSMEKAEFGSQIAGETAESLKDIVEGISESSELISEIARSSEEQSLGISQINTGIDQVAQVVQQNSATAEQSAAASEEMSSQSTMLEELISQFKIKNQNAAMRALPPSYDSPKPAPQYEANDVYEPDVGADSFGKY